MSNATTHIKTDKQLVPTLRFKEFEEDWVESKLSTGLFTDLKKNKDEKFQKEDMLSISSSAGVVNQMEYKGRSFAGASVAPYNILNKGQMVYTKSPLKEYPYGIIKFNDFDTGIVSTLYAIYSIKEGYDGEFIDCYFQHPQRLNKYLKPLVNIGAKNDMKVNNDKVLSDPVIFPSFPEQKKIASFLSAVDEKIQQLTKKKELLEQYKKGVMQQLFSGQLRFKDQNGNPYPDWEEKRLGEYLVKHSEVTIENDQYPVLTSSRRGLFFQKDYFNGQNVASKDTTGYNVVPRDYFTYRHMSDDLEFKFNINTICDRGIVSTLYPVFTTKDSLDDAFLILKLNNGDEFKRYAILQKQGGSRTYMYFKKLENLYINLPSFKEQQKIARYLSSIDTKIESVNNQISQTRTFKKGLLQQMFV